MVEESELTIWRKIDLTFSSEERVALTLALELSSELLGTDPRQLGLPGLRLTFLHRVVLAAVGFVLHVEIQ